jgi:hypothetical protein
MCRRGGRDKRVETGGRRDPKEKSSKDVSKISILPWSHVYVTRLLLELWAKYQPHVRIHVYRWTKIFGLRPGAYVAVCKTFTLMLVCTNV